MWNQWHIRTTNNQMIKLNITDAAGEWEKEMESEKNVEQE